MNFLKKENSAKCLIMELYTKYFPIIIHLLIFLHSVYYFLYSNLVTYVFLESHSFLPGFIVFVWLKQNLFLLWFIICFCGYFPFSLLGRLALPFFLVGFMCYEFCLCSSPSIFSPALFCLVWFQKANLFVWVTCAALSVGWHPARWGGRKKAESRPL